MPTGKKHVAVLRDSVQDALRDRVISGQLPPGSRLVERQLAQELDVSRVPVREALRALEREGFVEERPTRGMVVRRLSDDDLETLYQVRSALEEILCRRLVRTLDEQGLDRLQAVVDRTAAAIDSGDSEGAVAANASFHEVLVEEADSRVLASVIEPVAGQIRWLLSQHSDVGTMNAEHQVILAALRDRDADRAIEACRHHLISSRAEASSMSPGKRDLDQESGN
ncbi:GntR family transcriptional regulator [Knoellia sp. S7-12]|uniref:GntR family transcriptional regulator n=1 Tax=Knoellia sp. S7-12 TaxID=3126698 RepID=UPI003368DA07